MIPFLYRCQGHREKLSDQFLIYYFVFISITLSSKKLKNQSDTVCSLLFQKIKFFSQTVFLKTLSFQLIITMRKRFYIIKLFFLYLDFFFHIKQKFFNKEKKHNFDFASNQ